MLIETLGGGVERLVTGHFDGLITIVSSVVWVSMEPRGRAVAQRSRLRDALWRGIPEDCRGLCCLPKHQVWVQQRLHDGCDRAGGQRRYHARDEGADVGELVERIEDVEALPLW